ncbi:VOC family protein [Sphingobium sp. DC-2]|uniref:VOC family protein n=1 Tax=Sphingobium sp. DC-2 TaxID=1303256 RepID=UPI0004C3095B|nr:VOC family protein [Sphingobium sp. DC-2]
MLFERVDRVIAVVDDIEKAKDFFSDLLGWQFDDVIRDEAQQLAVVHAARHGFELGMPMSDRHPIAAMESKFLAENGPGLRAFVIKVSNLDDAVAHFRARGIEPVAINAIGTAREAFYNAKDTYGVFFILNEYPDPHPMTRIGMEAQPHKAE